MNFDYDIALNVVKWMAILCRTGAFMFSMPVFSGEEIPQRYKILFIAAFSFLLMPFVPGSFFVAIFKHGITMFSLFLFILAEVIIGLCISLIFQIIMEVFRFGGFLTDRGIGLMMAQQIDPASSTQATLFSNLYIRMFLMTFLIFDGHHEVLRIAALSFRTLPPGTFFVNDVMINEIINFSNTLFIVGLQIAIPVLTVNLMLNLAMGLLARVGQDFPVMMLSFPLRFAFGFIIILATIPITVWICRRMNEQLMNYLVGITGLM